METWIRALVAQGLEHWSSKPGVGSSSLPEGSAVVAIPFADVDITMAPTPSAFLAQQAVRQLSPLMLCTCMAPQLETHERSQGNDWMDRGWVGG
ncbi:unnamed protein product [Hydatigera taeniaeformis]|uniref:PH domain-containing protein n=1 Tax=Hydatigena taeniaeformis TaxID=6205 RepID=A0A0R3WXC4_HYDTA|nr:unnamed protein product [Hydatigera taeniaeformis]